MASAYFGRCTFLVSVAFDGTIDAPFIAAEEASGRVAVKIAFAAERIFAAYIRDTNQTVGTLLSFFAWLWPLWFDAGIRSTDFTVFAVFVTFTAVVRLDAFIGFADELSLAFFVATAFNDRCLIDAIAVFANLVAHAFVIEFAIFAHWGFDAFFVCTGIEFRAIIFGLTRVLIIIVFARAAVTNECSGTIITYFTFLLVFRFANLVATNVRAGAIVVDIAL